VDFVTVPPGPFLMGNPDGPPAERPVHQVWLDAFRIATVPVTNADFAAFMRATGTAPPAFWAKPGFDAPDQPVVGVTWEDAAAYAAWASGRLPTEAEWEKAARGGAAGAGLPWSGSSPATRFDRPPRVRTTPPNPLGLYDLSGVCHEWCSDWYDDTYYARSPATNPRGPDGGTRRVSRGGAWRHANPWSGVAHRSSLPSGLRYSDYGFRLVEDVATMTPERP
jgi:formylglycine-generating enzyme